MSVSWGIYDDFSHGILGLDIKTPRRVHTVNSSTPKRTKGELLNRYTIYR